MAAAAWHRAGARHTAEHHAAQDKWRHNTFKKSCQALARFCSNLLCQGCCLGSLCCYLFIYFVP